jgi:hypothetical protein
MEEKETGMNKNEIEELQEAISITKARVYRQHIKCEAYRHLKEALLELIKKEQEQLQGLQVVQKTQEIELMELTGRIQVVGRVAKTSKDKNVSRTLSETVVKRFIDNMGKEDLANLVAKLQRMQTQEK